MKKEHEENSVKLNAKALKRNKKIAAENSGAILSEYWFIIFSHSGIMITSIE